MPRTRRRYNVLESMWKEAVMIKMYYPRIYLEGLRKSLNHVKTSSIPTAPRTENFHSTVYKMVDTPASSVRWLINVVRTIGGIVCGTITLSNNIKLLLFNTAILCICVKLLTGIYVACDRRDMHIKVKAGNLKGRDHSESLGLIWRILLKLTCQEHNMRLWIRIVCPRIQTNGGLLWI
jgi:hypothetical protein